MFQEGFVFDVIIPNAGSLGTLIAFPVSGGTSPDEEDVFSVGRVASVSAGGIEKDTFVFGGVDGFFEEAVGSASGMIALAAEEKKVLLWVNILQNAAFGMEGDLFGDSTADRDLEDLG